MSNLADFWPIVTATAGVVFSAGILVEKIRNGKYAHKDICQEKHKHLDERWTQIEKYMDQNHRAHEEIFELLRSGKK